MKRKHAVMALIPISILAIGAPIFFLSGKSRPAETVKPSIPYRVSGTNFLKSDVAMEKAGRADDTNRAGHYGWTGKYKAVSTKYDNFDWAHAAPETIDRGLTVVRAEVTPSPVRITGKAGTSADLSAVSNLGEALTARSGGGHIIKISEAAGSGGKTSWKIGLLQKGVTVIHIRSACNAVCDVPVTVL